MSAFLKQIRRLVDDHELEQASDSLLIELFATRRDEAAFATLLVRHGPLVLRVCRQLLDNEHDVETPSRPRSWCSSGAADWPTLPCSATGSTAWRCAWPVGCAQPTGTASANGPMTMRWSRP
jgi:hypothetical protein